MTLEKLYVDAKRLLQGSNGAIELVVLTKMSEKNRHVQNEHPWGESPKSLKKLGHDEIARVIDAHFVSNGLNVVREITPGNDQIMWLCVTSRDIVGDSSNGSPPMRRQVAYC